MGVRKIQRKEVSVAAESGEGGISGGRCGQADSSVATGQGGRRLRPAIRVRTHEALWLQQERFGWPGGGSRILGEWVQETNWKGIGSSGSDNSLEACHRKGRQRTGPRRGRGQRHPGLQSGLASVRGVGLLGSTTGNDLPEGPSMAQGRVGIMVAAMSLNSKTRWDPGCSLRKDWDRKPLQADPGRLQTWGAGVRVSRALGLLSQGLWCLRAGESRSQPRWEVAVVMRRVEKARRRLPETGELNGHAVGMTAGSSPGRP